MLMGNSIGLVLHTDTAEAANPYLPLWEHVPDGEPHVFEDPDNPGEYRVYIYGSHDIYKNAYTEDPTIEPTTEPTAEPTAEPTTEPITETFFITVEDGNYVVTVPAEYADKTLFVAAYDENGALISLTHDAVGTAKGVLMKAFLWENNSMTPVCSCVQTT